MSLGATICALIFGAVAIVLGAAAYTGRDRSWLVTKSVLPGQSGPALLFVGIFLFMLPIALPLMDILPAILAFLLGVGVLGCLFVGVMGFFWLPRFMHPRWMREQYRAVEGRKHRARNAGREPRGL